MVEELKGGRSEYLEQMKLGTQPGGVAPRLGIVLFAEKGKPWTKQMVEALELLQEDHHEHLRCFRADAFGGHTKSQWEGLGKVLSQNDSPAVVTVLLNSAAQELGHVTGPSPSEVVKLVQSHLQQPSATVALELRLRALISQAPLMVFMKGTREEPFCKFSRQLMGLFECGGVLTEFEDEFATFDIFKDEQVRQGLKAFSNWPTYPQIYLGGKLIGGVDVIVQLAESLTTVSPPQTLGAELRRMLTEGDY